MSREGSGSNPLAWLDVAPVIVGTQEKRGYTLRRYEDDEYQQGPVYLGRGGFVQAFASTGGLLRFLATGEPHDLAAMDDWQDDVDWSNVDAGFDLAHAYVPHEGVQLCLLDEVGGTLEGGRLPLQRGRLFLDSYKVALEITQYANAPVDVAHGGQLQSFASDLSLALYTAAAGDEPRRRIAAYDTASLVEPWTALAQAVRDHVVFRP